MFTKITISLIFSFSHLSPLQSFIPLHLRLLLCLCLCFSFLQPSLSSSSYSLSFVSSIVYLPPSLQPLLVPSVSLLSSLLPILLHLDLSSSSSSATCILSNLSSFFFFIIYIILSSELFFVSNSRPYAIGSLRSYFYLKYSPLSFVVASPIKDIISNNVKSLQVMYKSDIYSIVCTKHRDNNL